MKKLLLFSPLIVSCSFLPKQAPNLTVSVSEPIIYLSQSEQIFSIKYGELSDNSLSFIKITLPEGIEKTLPRGFSASGARYLDERELDWWEHQGNVCLSKRDEKTQQWLRCFWTLKQAKFDKAL
jgi:membrane-bound inhibitor of C-type lysozyme